MICLPDYSICLPLLDPLRYGTAEPEPSPSHGNPRGSKTQSCGLVNPLRSQVFPKPYLYSYSEETCIFLRGLLLNYNLLQ